MAYTPGALPKDAPPWITRELLAISEAAVAAQPTVSFDLTSVEPSKPRSPQFYVADGTNWDPGYGPGPYLFLFGLFVPMFGSSIADAVIIACSDEVTDLTTGTAKVTFRMPYPYSLDEVRASVTTAPTGAAIVVDINEGGVSILSTPISIDAGSKTSTTSSTPAVGSDARLENDAEITIDIDQVGSTVAGTGLKVTIIGRRVT